MEGLDGHFSNGKLQYKIFAAGIGWATGLILRKAPISGSSTTRTLLPLFSFDNAIFIPPCIVCKYCDIVFASHFLCPKWAAARQTGSKSKSKVQEPNIATGLRNASIYTNRSFTGTFLSRRIGTPWKQPAIGDCCLKSFFQLSRHGGCIQAIRVPPNPFFFSEEKKSMFRKLIFVFLTETLEGCSSTLCQCFLTHLHVES